MMAKYTDYYYIYKQILAGERPIFIEQITMVATMYAFFARPYIA